MVAKGKWVSEMVEKKGEWFDYTNVHYISASKKVNITCKVCNNSFAQTPDSHQRRVGKLGCPYCAGKMYTTDTVKEKIKGIHGNKYGLDKVHFTGTRNKVTLTCHKHGDFHVTVNNLFSKKTGCIKCAEEANGLACRMTVAEFLEIANSRFDYKYTYPDLEFSSINEYITIVCPIHGESMQKAKEHMRSITGCTDCGNAAKADKNRDTIEEFTRKASIVHNNYYDYSDAIYINSKTLITITCPIHGNFEQHPNDHLQGRGCQSCANYGFKDYLPARLYYIKVEYGPFIAYKIGITNRTVEERLVRDLDKITILKVWEYPHGGDARKEESRVLNSFKVYKWSGIELLHSGNTELFDRDVLELDNGENNE